MPNTRMNCSKISPFPATTLSAYRYLGTYTYLNPSVMATNFLNWQYLRKCSLAERRRPKDSPIMGGKSEDKNMNRPGGLSTSQRLKWEEDQRNGRKNRHWFKIKVGSILRHLAPSLDPSPINFKGF